MRDTGNHTGEQRTIAAAILRVVKRSKPQTVQRRDWTSPHRENIAQDAADARGCALKWLNKGRMIMRFDLECRTPAIADIDDAGVLARRHNHTVAAGRQALQMNARRLVRTMLGPHD